MFESPKPDAKRNCRAYHRFLLAALGTLVAGCGATAGGGGTAGDANAGQNAGEFIAETDPADGTANVAADALITITFTKPADPESIGGSITPPVDYNLTWSPDNTTLTVTPVAPLAAGIEYTVTITELAFADGSRLEGLFTFTFRMVGGTDVDDDDDDLIPSTDKWVLWSSGRTRLRGADLHPCANYDESTETCLQLITRQDVQDLKDLGANLINASYPGLFTERSPYEVDSTTEEYLDNLIDWAEEVGIYVVIHIRTGPGRNEWAIQVGMGREELATVWTEQEAHDAWIDMWRHIAERYADSPVVVGYNLMVEPHAESWMDPAGELSPEEFRDRYEGTLADWNAFALEITDAIREVDTETPIIVDSLQWANVVWFPALAPTGDSRTIYSFHGYDPGPYTHPVSQEEAIQYPSIVEYEGEMVTLDRDWLADYYQPAVQFAQEHDVPIYVGEFGVFRWVPGATEFIEDLVGLFEEHGWNHAYYVWRGDVPGFDAFNMEYGPDPNDTALVPGNPLLDAFTREWSQNTDFPPSGS